MGLSSRRGERRERRWLAGTLAPPLFEGGAFSGLKGNWRMNVGFWVEGWSVARNRAGICLDGL